MTYKPFKYSMELPIFLCLHSKALTSRELSYIVGESVEKIIRVMSFYSDWKYVTGTQDRSIKGKPKRYKLTSKGIKKLMHMQQLKRDHLEQWGKPK